MSAFEGADPGRFSFDLTPYLRAPLDAAVCGDFDEIVCMKAARVGWTEGVGLNAMAYWIDQDPGHVLYVWPKKEKAQRSMKRRIKPMLQNTPKLQEHQTDNKRDLGNNNITLRNMVIDNASAQSPGDMTSDTYRFCIFEEPDEYLEFSGEQGDPIKLGKVRMWTYRDRGCTINGGKPITRGGHTYRAWKNCPIKLRYFVPCPHCGHYQTLNFDNVRKPETKTGEWEGMTRKEIAEVVQIRDLAWYRCEALCGEDILERHKMRMIQSGVWASVDAVVTQQDVEEAIPSGYRVDNWNGILWKGIENVETRQIGFHISTLYSPWKRWSEVIAEFYRCIGNVAELQEFHCSWLGEPFHDERARVTSDEMEVKMQDGPAGVVPDWATAVLCTADTQKDHFYYVVRAWGRDFRSQLIQHGIVYSFEELRAVGLNRVWNVGLTLQHDHPVTIRTARLGVDAGGAMIDEDTDQSKTHEVYQFALSDKNFIIPMRGHGGRQQMERGWQWSSITYTPRHGQPYKVGYLRFSMNQKDVLASRIKNKKDDPEHPAYWGLNDAVDHDYLAQMKSEHKILIRKGSQREWRWEPITIGAANHYWDCEVEQIVLADYLQVCDWPTLKEEILRLREVSQSRPEPGVRMPDGREFYVNQR